MFGEQFYPTPLEVAEKMLSKVDLRRVQFILEPSAGRGDLLKAVEKQIARERGREQNPISLQCIEIDEDLRSMLRGKGWTVIGSDFLEFSSFQRFDLCPMNPPFRDGDKHLLHALRIMSNGGQIVCMLNAETLRNPVSNIRVDLMQRLDALEGAEVEIISGAFRSAERSTDVDIAIVYVDIPEVAQKNVTAHLEAVADEFRSDGPKFDELAVNDQLKALVKQYQLSCIAGLESIDRLSILQKYIPGNGRYEECLLTLKVYSPEDHIPSLANRFIRQLRYEFWRRLFKSDQMAGLLTHDVREQFEAQIEKMRDYDFTLSNIKQIQLDLARGMSQDIEQAIMKMFEQLTYEHSTGKSTNIHYYNGWKTNKAYKINSKVIIPCWGLYDSLLGWSVFKANNDLSELEKILTYLDAGRTEGDDYYTVMRQLSEKGTFRKHYVGETIDYKYFSVSYKKKGTIHVWFKDPDLLKKFNVFGANKKGWLPPSYGKKAYKDMPREEQQVVKSFESLSDYETTLSAPGYFLGVPELKMLAG